MKRHLSSLFESVLRVVAGIPFLVAALAVFVLAYGLALSQLDWEGLHSRERYVDEFRWSWRLAAWGALAGGGLLVVFLSRVFRLAWPKPHAAVGFFLVFAVFTAAASNLWNAHPLEWVTRYTAVRGGNLLDSIVFKPERVYRPYFTYLFIAKHMKGKEIVIFENDFMGQDLLEHLGEVRVRTDAAYRHTLSDRQAALLLTRENLLLVNRSSRGVMIDFYMIESYASHGHARYLLMSHEGYPRPANPADGREYETSRTRYFLVPEALVVGS